MAEGPPDAPFPPFTYHTSRGGAGGGVGGLTPYIETEEYEDAQAPMAVDLLEEGAALSTPTKRKRVESPPNPPRKGRWGETSPGSPDKEMPPQQKPRDDPKPLYVVYIKGVTKNITHIHPQKIKTGINDQFGTVIKVELAGLSLRVTCTSECQQGRILACTHLVEMA